MSAASQAIQWVLGGAFAALGLVSVEDWRRQRDRLRRYLALSVGLLGVVGLLSTVAAVGFDPGGVLSDVTLIAFLASGWAFLMFRDFLVPLSRVVRTGVTVLVVATGLLLLIAYAPARGNPSLTPIQAVAVIALLVVWAGCVAEPIQSIWSISKTFPSVQRARLRSLVGGYAGIVGVLLLDVIAAFAPVTTAAIRIVTLALSCALIPLFYFAFSPPQIVRRFWREGEEREFRQALNALLEWAPDSRTLAERAVHWAARLVGADAAVIATDDAEVLVTHGLGREAGWQVVSGLVREEGADDDSLRQQDLIRVPLQSRYGGGTLAVRAGKLTPLFSQDEAQRLQDYAVAFTTALERVQLVERLQRATELFNLAYNAILTWSAKTGTILYWNNAAHELYGWTADEAVGRAPGELLKSELPIPREEIVEHMSEGRPWEGEIQQQTKSGRYITVDARWAMQLDSNGRPDVIVEINRDITRQKQDAAELRHARDVAEHASRAKSEYLSRMSHELRTPLTAILGYSDLLELREPRDDQLEAVGAIQEASSHLLSLVNDVLDIARIESGRESIAPEPVSLAAAVEESVRLVSPAARSRNITVTVDLDSVGEAAVEADRQRLIQALLNLLSNAVKYSGNEAHVTVRAEAVDNSQVRISVIDDGPGISPENQQRLFQPFERLGAERTGIQGTGLGLALTKHLVEAMGGEIGVQSEPGSGTTFSIVLARAAIDVAPQRLRSGRNAVPPRGSAEEHCVLYVEDNLATIGLMEDVFKMRPSIRLITAMQGSLALDLARQHKPGLIILDVHLPDMSGDDVLKQLQNDPETAAIPVVMFSADATERQAERFLGLGARRYIVKPAKVPEFLAMLDEMLTPSPIGAR